MTIAANMAIEANLIDFLRPTANFLTLKILKFKHLYHRD